MQTTCNFCAESEEDWNAERARVKKLVRARREAALGRRRDCALSECSSISSWGIVVGLIIGYRQGTASGNVLGRSCLNRVNVY